MFKILSNVHKQFFIHFLFTMEKKYLIRGFGFKHEPTDEYKEF